MISGNLVDLIKENADELTRRLMKDLLSREETKSYRTFPENVTYDRVHDVYNRLDIWLGRELPKAEVERIYVEVGRKRFQEGIPLHELLMALMLIKRHLWLFVLERHFFDSTFQISQALELNNRVVLFFDRMMFFCTVGYEQELTRGARESGEAGFLSRFFRSDRTATRGA